MFLEILVLLWKICKVILMVFGFIFLIILFCIFFRYEPKNKYSSYITNISKKEIAGKIDYFDFTVITDRNLELKNIKIYNLGKALNGVEESKIRENEENIKDYMKGEIFNKDINSSDIEEYTFNRYKYEIKEKEVLQIFGENNTKYNIYYSPYVYNGFSLKLTLLDKINNKYVELDYILNISFDKKGFHFWLPV